MRLMKGCIGLLAAGVALDHCHVRAQQIEVNKANRTIAVTATDKATADAEVATVHVGFQVYAADSQAATRSVRRIRTQLWPR